MRKNIEAALVLAIAASAVSAHKNHNHSGSSSSSESDSSQFHAMLMQLLPSSPVMASFMSALGIITVPFFLMFVLPRSIPQSLLTVLISFAVGNLLGDSFLHVMPHIFSHHHHHHDHGHDAHHEDQQSVRNSLAIVFGFLAFMCFDKFLRLTGGHHHHHHHETCEADNHTHEEKTTSKQSPKTLRKRKNGKKQVESEYAVEKSARHDHHDHHHEEIKTASYLTTLANIIHTVTDGLTLAIAHHTSPAIGISTTMAVFLHEIPHKLGDYAILIQSGISRPRAFLMQIMSAIGTLLGVLLGCVARQSDPDHPFNQLMIAFSAGGMIYTTTVGIIPELMETKSITMFALQIVSISVGVLTMAAIALNE